MERNILLEYHRQLEKHFLLVVQHSNCSHKDEKVYLLVIYMIIINKTRSDVDASERMKVE